MVIARPNDVGGCRLSVSHWPRHGSNGATCKLTHSWNFTVLVMTQRASGCTKAGGLSSRSIAHKEINSPCWHLVEIAVVCPAMACGFSRIRTFLVWISFDKGSYCNQQIICMSPTLNSRGSWSADTTGVPVVLLYTCTDWQNNVCVSYSYTSRCVKGVLTVVLFVLYM